MTEDDQKLLLDESKTLRRVIAELAAMVLGLLILVLAIAIFQGVSLWVLSSLVGSVENLGYK